MLLPLQEYLEKLHRELLELRSGNVADYIPELTKVDADGFGICLTTLDGVTYAAGDADLSFTIQSISKPFVYGTALTDRGLDHVSKRLGVEPSGDAFNSISLDPQTGAPFNPMINAGAIAATSMAGGETPDAQWQRIVTALGVYVGRELSVDEAVYQSESNTGARNRAIAWMLKNFNIMEGDPMPMLENYFRQCSLLVSCRDLSLMAATLANDGVHPVTGKRALPSEEVAHVLSVMATCGMYDYAGSWLFEVGIPAKSGVGGGIIAVLPGRFGIGVYSPRLDEKGNSVRGIATCKRLSKELGLNMFRHGSKPETAISRVYTAAEVPSRRVPDAALRELLQTRARRIKYVSLHGYLGVASIEYCIRRLHLLAPDSESFILDMHQVSGIDEAAARLLHQACHSLMQENIAIVFSRIRERKALLDPLRRNDLAHGRGFLSFEDNDLAVEWCENRIRDSALPPQARPLLRDYFLFAGVPAELLERLAALATTRDYKPGESILNNNTQDDDRIFLLEAGNVSILVPRQAGGFQRIATIGPGMNFGEMALLGHATRSATVMADTDVRCQILHAAELQRLAETAPELRIRLLENLARDLGNKLKPTTEMVAALS